MSLEKCKSFHPGMGQAVAERTILRKKKNGEWETWADVAHRVALGNSLLCRTKEEQKKEYEVLYKHILKGSILMSGRHLQHGDETQPEKSMELHTNCSTSCTSFALFYLLMSGSGVGRSYDDDMMLVNWDNAPTVLCVLDESHPDFDHSAHESVRDAKHKYGGKDVLWHTVGDTREGWAKALEIWENATFEKIHKDKLLILDFSNVRSKGTPIKGMQDRPASGPVPLMNAFQKALTLKGSGLPKFMQTMYVDHYFAECVLVGGARRAARMSVKYWKDETIFDFITIKRPIEYCNKNVEEIIALRESCGKNKPQGFLWSSNNSILVDKEFWSLLKVRKNDPEHNTSLAKHARKVFKLASSAAYGDGTGEPGFINVDKLNVKEHNVDTLSDGDLIGSRKYQVEDDTNLYLKRLLKKALKKTYWMIVNPCVTSDTWIQTSDGPRQVKDLINKPFDAVVNGKSYKATGFWKTGNKPIFCINTDRGFSIKATENHKFLVERNKRQKLGGGYNFEHVWVELKDLEIGDNLVLSNQRNISWPGEGSFEQGWLIGEMLGDGGHNPDKYESYVRFWGEDQEKISDYAYNCIKNLKTKSRNDFRGIYNKTNKCTTLQCVALGHIVEGLLEPSTKNLLPKIEEMSSEFYKGFICGIVDSDGTIDNDDKKGRYIRISQNDLSKLKIIQRMLARLGMPASIYENRQEARYKEMPNGKGGTSLYWCEAMHELHISKDNLPIFEDLIELKEPAKKAELRGAIESIKRGFYKENFFAKVKSIKDFGTEDVYDCTVEEIHAFDANGFVAHNCSEIAIAVWGAFCTIGDGAPYHADTLDEVEEAFRAIVRALIRVNTMDSIYGKEVKRTNRIGVGITGIHEFAWKFFRLGFRDLIDEGKSKEFWMTLARFKRAIQEESEAYAKKYGVEVPHTDTTIKPAGTNSKLFGLTEGWHLAAMRWYVRWVQFSENDPLVEVYRKSGYPTRQLKKYKNTVIVGFPTTPVIVDLGMEDRLVTAAEATPEEQYKWIQLGEKYWIRGVDLEGKLLEKDTGNQISFTLKYDPKKVSYKDFVRALKKNQAEVKCCSIMPQEETSSYEYLPEQPVSKAEYNAIVANIRAIKEDIDLVHVDCASGACPINFNKKAI